MAVSKTLRYEILRRDDHTCRYCGAKAPDVKLQIDHVTPVALGGEDVAENLVTACEPCNTGKGKIPAGADKVAEVERLADEWTAAMALSADRFAGRMSAREDEALRVAVIFHKEWDDWTNDGTPMPLPGDYRQSLLRLIANGLPEPMIGEAVEITMNRKGLRNGNLFPYFCGVCWKTIREIQDGARQIVEAAE